MALEDLTGPNVYWGALVRTNPEGSDPKSEGDDHIRGVKNVALNTNPRVNDAMDWSAFEANQIIPVSDATVAVLNSMVSMVSAFAAGPPPGWLLCDGAAHEQALYPILYALIGDFYTSVPGPTFFNVPDYRGYFQRAQDAGSGRDPDAASRNARPDGTAGDNLGTTQGDAFESHTHAITPVLPNAQVAGGVLNIYSGIAGGGLTTWIAANTGGNETRGINISVTYAIRADWQPVLKPVERGDDPV